MSDSIISRKPKPTSASLGVVEQRVRSRDGRVTTIRKVDVASPTFGEDMLYVFRKNVAAARRENKRIIGVADVAPAKE